MPSHTYRLQPIVRTTENKSHVDDPSVKKPLNKPMRHQLLTPLKKSTDLQQGPAEFVSNTSTFQPRLGPRKKLQTQEIVLRCEYISKTPVETLFTECENNILNIANFLKFFSDVERYGRNSLKEHYEKIAGKKEEFIAFFLNALGKSEQLQQSLIANPNKFQELFESLTQNHQIELINNIGIPKFLVEMVTKVQNILFLQNVRNLTNNFSGLNAIQLRSKLSQVLSGENIFNLVKTEDDVVNGLKLLIDKPEQLRNFIERFKYSPEKQTLLHDIVHGIGNEEILNDIIQVKYHDSNEEDLKEGKKILFNTFNNPNTPSPKGRRRSASSP